METAEVVIAGAGIIGLSLALDLAAHGLSVTVVERGRAMSEASWAAAGMLAAHDPNHPSPLNQLASFSLALYPDYLAQIEQLSGRKVPLRTKAAIQAINDAPAAELSSAFGKARKLSHAELQAIEPGVQPQHQRFLLVEEFSLDPRDLCAALPAAAIAAGVTLVEDSPVISIDAESARVVVQTTATAIAATHFVNCAGAWAESSALGPLPPAIRASRPLKVK